MDVRGCTKGKGGDRGGEEGWWEGDAITKYARFGGSECGGGGREESEGGHDTTTVQHVTQQRAQNTQTKSQSTPRTHKLHHGHSEKSKQSKRVRGRERLRQRPRVQSLEIRAREGRGRFCALKEEELKRERDVNVPNQKETRDLFEGRRGKEEEEERGEVDVT